MHKKLIPKGQNGLVTSNQAFPRYDLGFQFNWNQFSPLSQKTAEQEKVSNTQIPMRPEEKQQPKFNLGDYIPWYNENTTFSTPQSSGVEKNFSSAVNSFASSGKGQLLSGGIDTAMTAFGLKPQYQMNSDLDSALGMTEQISKNFGNPLVNSIGDAASGGIGKLMGLNTDKVVGGGMAGVNTVSNVLSSFGPIGMAASVGLKSLNMIGGKNLDEFKTDSRVQQSSSYTGSASTIKKTSDKYGGGMVSGIDRLFGKADKYNQRIREQKDIQRRIKGILTNADQDFAASTGSADMFRMRNSMNMQDNSYLFNGVLSAKRGGRVKRIVKSQKGGSFEAFRRSLPKPLQDTIYYRLRTLWDLNGKPADFNSAVKSKIFTKQKDGYHAPSVAYDENKDEYLFLKVPSHPSVSKELDWYESDDAKSFRKQYKLDKSTDIWKYISIKDAEKFANGGKMNVIPEGALHAHKHKLDMDDITLKGIPVISEEDGGKVVQHAEIERNEIVFTKDVSSKLEELWNKYNEEGLSKKEKDQIAIQAGELLTYEIIENTDDKTGLMTTV